MAIVVACPSCLGLLAGGMVAVTADLIGAFWAGLLPAALLLGGILLWISGLLVPAREGTPS